MKRLEALLAEHAAEASGRPLRHRSRVQTRRQSIGRALHPLVPLRMSKDGQETRRGQTEQCLLEKEGPPRVRHLDDHRAARVVYRSRAPPSPPAPPMQRLRMVSRSHVAATVRSTSKPSSRRTGMRLFFDCRDHLSVHFPRPLHEAQIQLVEMRRADDGARSADRGLTDHAQRRLEIGGAVVHPGEHVRVGIDDVRGGPLFNWVLTTRPPEPTMTIYPGLSGGQYLEIGCS